MRNLDLNSLLRSTVGFDRLLTSSMNPLGGRVKKIIIRYITSSAPGRTTIKSRWR
jgi:hypothetical protein